MTDHDEERGGDAEEESETDGGEAAPAPPPRVDPRTDYGGLSQPPPPPPAPADAPPPAAPLPAGFGPPPADVASPVAPFPAPADVAPPPPAPADPAAPPPAPADAPPPAAPPPAPADVAPPGGFGPPPAAPAGFGPPPPPGGGTGPTGVGPVEYGGFGPHFPPPPPAPPAVRPPRDQRVALTAALLNLSGLGAGHAYLRRWWGIIPSLLLTGALLVMALPVTAEGISGQWVALYCAGLLLLAADAWRVARPATPRRSTLTAPLVAGVLLLAIPAGAVVLFEDAQRSALESDLQDRLTATDELVERAAATSFAQSEARYRDAIDDYLGVRDAYPDTDAAAEVPARLDALYERATGEGESDDQCARVNALRFFRDLPGDTGDDPEARRLSAQAMDALPEPLHGCGLALTAQRDVDGAEAPFTELLEEHADSSFAIGLPEELGGMQGAAVEGVEGDDPCGSLERLRDFNALFAHLPGEDFARLAAEGEEPVPDGLYACGTAQFREGDYSSAVGTLRDLLDEAPDHAQAEYAEDIVIAAQIADELPAAGESLPPRPGSGGGGSTISVEIFNDSPDALELLWTGPRTGSVTLDACGSCSSYPGDPGDAACGENIDYPSTTLELPAGTYHFLHRAPELDINTLAETETFEPDYVYTWCTYTTEDLLLPGGGPDGTDA